MYPTTTSTHYAGKLSLSIIICLCFHLVNFSFATSEPVAWWKFDEMNGSVTEDSMGDKNGQLINGPSWTEGIIGGALSFDGIDDFVEIINYPGITGITSRSCTAWVKTQKNSAQILSWGTGETGSKWIIRTNENGTLRAEVSGGYIFGSTPIVDNEWHHIAVTWQADNTPDIEDALLYVDGNLEYTPGVSSQAMYTATADSMKVGVFTENSNFFNGLIDDVRIYNQALSQEEIALLYEEVFPLDICSEVWVDDDYSPDGTNDGHIWKYDAYNKIADGILATITGGTVHVASGHYIEHVALKNNVKLLGQNPESTIIDANYKGSAVSAHNCNSNTVLDGFTIMNGRDYTESNRIWFGSGFLSLGSSPIINNCFFINNSSDRGGGGIHNGVNSNPTITNCKFINNSAINSEGGAIFYNWAYSGDIQNCLFINNSADSLGGAIYNGGDCHIINCTFYGNSPAPVYVNNSLIIENCILWDNIGGEIARITDISHSNIAGFEDIMSNRPHMINDLGGNIGIDPLFIDPDGPDDILGTIDDDFRLSSASDCIDAGDNTAVNSESDLQGNLRILDSNCDGDPFVDMGAYEYKPVTGDVDDNCVVNIDDFIVMSEVWLEKACTPCSGADLDLDSNVTITDFSILASEWINY